MACWHSPLPKFPASGVRNLFSTPVAASLPRELAAL